MVGPWSVSDGLAAAKCACSESAQPRPFGNSKSPSRTQNAASPPCGSGAGPYTADERAAFARIEPEPAARFDIRAAFDADRRLHAVAGAIAQCQLGPRRRRRREKRQRGGQKAERHCANHRADVSATATARMA